MRRSIYVDVIVVLIFLENLNLLNQKFLFQQIILEKSHLNILKQVLLFRLKILLLQFTAYLV